VPVTVGERTIKRLIDGEETPLTRSATAKRWTFVIDRQGKIAYKDSAVKAKQDPSKIQAVVKSIR
jgi:peroxiredoxin Q/BCP